MLTALTCLIIFLAFGLGTLFGWYFSQKSAFLQGYAAAVDDQFKRLRNSQQPLWKVKTVKTTLRLINGGKK